MTRKGEDAASALGIALLAYPGVDELDLVGVLVPLTKAAAEGGPLRPVLVGPTPLVAGSAGLAFPGVSDLAVMRQCAAVVVPGGAGAGVAANEPRIRAELRAAESRGCHMYAVCSGALILAAAGILRGRRAAVHHRKTDVLRRAGVDRVEAGLIRDGRITTAGGIVGPRTKSIDVAYAVLRDWAPETIVPVSHRLEVSAP